MCRSGGGLGGGENGVRAYTDGGGDLGGLWGGGNGEGGVGGAGGEGGEGGGENGKGAGGEGGAGGDPGGCGGGGGCGGCGGFDGGGGKGCFGARHGFQRRSYLPRACSCSRRAPLSPARPVRSGATGVAADAGEEYDGAERCAPVGRAPRSPRRPRLTPATTDADADRGPSSRAVARARCAAAPAARGVSGSTGMPGTRIAWASHTMHIASTHTRRSRMLRALYAASADGFEGERGYDPDPLRRPDRDRVNPPARASALRSKRWQSARGSRLGWNLSAGARSQSPSARERCAKQDSSPRISAAD